MMAGLVASNPLVDHLSAALLAPMTSGQGLHPDPIDLPAPDARRWEAEHGIKWSSGEMRTFRACLARDGLDVREAVLDDLATYHGLSKEACRQICIHWEDMSVEEWESADRSTPEGVVDFYDVARSWVFDLLWYAYLQSLGHGIPASAMAADLARSRGAGSRHLDFGSGVGVTSQLFSRLGFNSTMADVSRPLLDFAKWRLRRHGDDAISAICLRTEALPDAAYDFVTAIDTLVHVPDYDEAARNLHRAMRPGAWLVTNFDIRSREDAGSAWHLYDSAVDLDLRLRRAGFVYCGSVGPILRAYRRVEPNGLAHRLGAISTAVTAPLRKAKSALGRLRWPSASHPAGQKDGARRDRSGS